MTGIEGSAVTEAIMRTKHAAVVSLCLCAIPLFGCVVNKAISASAVADNLAVEKAQNEMLLLNVLRAQEHSPMYVTGISKITGSVKAEASLNPTVPFGSVTGGDSLRETSTRTHYMTAATATYNWNPSFDVNVLDTSEFMRGFLAPVSGDTFAYYWNQDYPPELLFHLMVQKIQIKVKHGVCDATDKSVSRNVDEYIFHNHPDSLDASLRQLKQFTRGVNELMKYKPYMAPGDSEPTGPELTKAEALKSRAIVEALKGGYTLAKQDTKDRQETVEKKETPKNGDEKEPDKFRFQPSASPSVLRFDLKGDRWQQLYGWIVTMGGSQGVEFNSRSEAYKGKSDSEGCPPPPPPPPPMSNAKKPSKQGVPQPPPPPATSNAENSQSTPVPEITSGATTGKLTESGLVDASDIKKASRMTITFSLRSPEAILYYLGELARFEKVYASAFYVCLQHQPEPFFAPVFVVRNSGCSKRSVEATSGDGSRYYIPIGDKTASSSCNDEGTILKFDSSCQPGSSMTTLTVVSQLIALQKSAKDLPTTTVVRVVGQ
jgi:hypothetical protein